MQIIVIFKDHRLSSEDLQKLYPKWDTFLKIRESFDPDGLFLNTHLKRIFNMWSIQILWKFQISLYYFDFLDFDLSILQIVY